MDRITQQLANYPVIGLDTSIFIYHFEAHPRYQCLTSLILEGVENGKWAAVTSMITLMVLTVRPWQLEREDITRKYEALLSHFPHLDMVEIDRYVTSLAAQLRARYSLRSPDAIQAAACLTHGGKAWVTNDRKFTVLKPLIDVILLEDYLQ